MISILFNPVPELSFTSVGVVVSEAEPSVNVCVSLSLPLSTSLIVPLTLGDTSSASEGKGPFDGVSPVMITIYL